jgi:Squalene-hopene cyclase C-terminal domain
VSYSEELLDRQNRDGGWSYGRVGSSWTEPTCYALLALAAGELSSSDAARRGLQWLASRQRPDGGWAPRESVDESTWVTALMLLLPPDRTPGVDRNRASQWLLAQTGRESGLVYRLRLRLLGLGADPTQRFDGWPWYPDTAAWVVPTALTLLALERFNRSANDSQVQERIGEGRSFLLARRCRDGGWNHGSTHALGYDSDSYPETTGLALLALHDATPSELGGALDLAERHLRESQSLEATSWLTLGLLAHGRTPSAGSVIPHQGTVAITLAALAEASRQGRNVFVG